MHKRLTTCLMPAVRRFFMKVVYDAGIYNLTFGNTVVIIFIRTNGFSTVRASLFTLPVHDTIAVKANLIVSFARIHF